MIPNHYTKLEVSRPVNHCSASHIHTLLQLHMPMCYIPVELCASMSTIFMDDIHVIIIITYMFCIFHLYTQTTIR